jgi:bifunctional enzyme CysN/CysC
VSGVHLGNATRDGARIDPQRPLSAIGQRGATVWLTGLSACGKSSIGTVVETTLIASGRGAYLLDGDVLRTGINSDLGFDRESRRENVRRIAHIAALFAESGAVAIVSLISPYAADRRAARALHERAGLPFLEVFVDTPLQICEQRDPKGLYRRARAGELSGMTGIDDPYEAPPKADLVIDGARVSVDDAAELVLRELRFTASQSSPKGKRLAFDDR